MKNKDTPPIAVLILSRQQTCLPPNTNEIQRAPPPPNWLIFTYNSPKICANGL